MKNEDVLWRLEHTINTFECLRDDNLRVYETYEDGYFKGKAQAYDLAVHNLNNVLLAISGRQ